MFVLTKPIRTFTKRLAGAVLICLLASAVAHGFDTYNDPKIPENLPALVRTHIERLYSKDTDVRVAAARAIGEMGEEALSAIPFLLHFIIFFDEVQHSDWWGEQGTRERLAVAEECAVAIGRMAEAAIEPLIDYLDWEGPLDWDAVPYAFARIGEPAVEPLIESLKNEDNTFTDRSSRVFSALRQDISLESVASAMYYKEYQGSNFFALRALQTITGQYPGDNHNSWATWYNNNKQTP
jgi:hypothetical protein